MRRLPVYFLIDVSESMVGDQINSVEEGISHVIQELKKDPYALETVFISIIVFAGKAKTIIPLTDIITFYPPKFSIGSGTNLGDGLGQLMFEMRKNYVPTTPDKKGDWKPIVFLFSDGAPTDGPQTAINEWKQNWAGKSSLIAISLGDAESVGKLKEITQEVYLINDTSANTYKNFFKWVTASIKASSVSVTDKGTHQMANTSGLNLEKIDLTKNEPESQNIDPNFAVFIAKCQNTKREYLIKYKKQIQESEFSSSLGFGTLVYRLTGAYQVNQDYHELSSDQQIDQKISTENLQGFPTCPCCGNQFGIAVCSCNKILCSGEEKITTCPWCGIQGQYGHGSGSIDLNRNLG
jgi:uncharacterized protein YegL